MFPLLIVALPDSIWLFDVPQSPPVSLVTISTFPPLLRTVAEYRDNFSPLRGLSSALHKQYRKRGLTKLKRLKPPQSPPKAA